MPNSFKQLLVSHAVHPVIDASIMYNSYVPLDLSITNEALSDVDVSSSVALQDYIDAHLVKHNGTVAYGGYNETRGIYKRSDYFNQNNPETERNVHLGIDLWIAAGTSVHAPLDAKVHSFKNNSNFGDYGPTIILEHQVQDVTFYTLYGHLSTLSLRDLKVGQVVQKGQPIATLGFAHENGDYAPHLHFQLIKDLQDYNGDYPGVSNKQDLVFYLNNCPDPKLLLNIEA